jgi:nitrogen fixation protein FixH
MPTSLNQTPEAGDGEFRLTGRHVLAILLTVLFLVIVVNGVMIWKAIGSFPGVVTESSYRDSQRFNRAIAAAHEQAARGWKVDAQAVRSADGRVVVHLEAKDAQDRPVSGVAFHATLQHPANRSLDHAVPLPAVPGAAGVFEGVVTGVTEGKWGLEVVGETEQGRIFLSQNALFLR